MKNCTGFLLIGILLLVGCRDTSINVTNDNQEFAIEGDTPIPNQITTVWRKQDNSKPKQKKNELNVSSDLVGEIYSLLNEYTNQKKSPYAAFISKKKKKHKKGKKFKYRYFKLHPPKKAIEEANGEKKFYFHIFVDPADNEIYQIFAVLVPDTEEQLEAVKEWGKKLGSTSPKAKSLGGGYEIMSCGVEEGLTWIPECGCYAPGTIEVCSPADDAEEFDDGDGGGGDGTSDCYYEPGGCEEDPDPDLPDGGGGTGDDDLNNCPTGQVKDANGNCITAEVPCVGNPIKNPRIAEQTNSGINGGRKGFTRSGGDQFHSGLDLKNDVGKPWFSPFSGNIDAVGETEKLGYYVTIRFQKNGIYYTMQFGHLQENSWPPNGSTINAGDVIGIQGLSGNLENAIRTGATNDVHSHVIVRKRTGTGWDTENDYGDPLNPEAFIKTKFDDNGTPVSGTDC